MLKLDYKQLSFILCALSQMLSGVVTVQVPEGGTFTVDSENNFYGDRGSSMSQRIEEVDESDDDNRENVVHHQETETLQRSYSRPELFQMINDGNFEDFKRAVSTDPTSVDRIDSEYRFTVFHSLSSCRIHSDQNRDQNAQIECLLWLLKQPRFDQIANQIAPNVGHFLCLLTRKQTDLVYRISQQQWKEILDAINRFYHQQSFQEFDIRSYGRFFMTEERIPTPLIYFAVKNNIRELVNELLRSDTLAVYRNPGIDINARIDNDRSLLYYTITNEFPELLSRLLGYRPSYNRLRVNDLFTYEYHGISHASLQSGMQLTNQTPLMLASYKKFPDDLVRELIQRSYEEVNTRDAIGQTVLHKAIVQKNCRFVELLLSARKESGDKFIDLTDPSGMYRDILLYTLSCGEASREMLVTLIENGAFMGKIDRLVKPDIFPQDFRNAFTANNINHGCSFIYAVLVRGYTPLLENVLSGANNRLGSDDLYSYCYLGFNFGNVKQGDILTNQTPLMITSYMNFYEKDEELLKNLIKNFSSAINKRDSLQETVLHKAIVQGKTCLVKALLNAKDRSGACSLIDLKNNNMYKDILLYALSWEVSPEIIAELINHGAFTGKVETLIKPTIFPRAFAERFSRDDLKTPFHVLLKYACSGIYFSETMQYLIENWEQFGLESIINQVLNIAEQQTRSFTLEPRVIQAISDIRDELGRCQRCIQKKQQEDLRRIAEQQETARIALEEEKRQRAEQSASRRRFALKCGLTATCAGAAYSVSTLGGMFVAGLGALASCFF